MRRRESPEHSRRAGVEVAGRYDARGERRHRSGAAADDAAGRPIAAPLPERDVRRKRPPALSFLLRMDTLRRLAARSCSLLALDFVGVFAAIFTALMLKAALRGDAWASHASLREAEHYVAVRLPRDGAAVRPLGPLRRPRRAPGPAAHRRLAVPGHGRRAALRGRRAASTSPATTSSTATLVFAIVYRLGAALGATTRVTGRLLRAAGYHRRARARRHRPAHRGRRARAGGERARAEIEVVGFISLTPRPDNGLRSLGHARRPAREVLERSTASTRSSSPTPTSRRSEAVELVDQCHQRGVARAHRAVDDGDPDPPRGVRARAVGAAVRAAAAGLRGLRLRASSARSTWSARSLLLMLLSARCCCAIALAVKLTSRGPVLYRSMRPGIGGVPFACLKFRTMHDDADDAPGGPRGAQRGRRRAVQDPRRPAPDAGRPPPAALLARRAAAAVQRRCAARCRSSARARCRSATTTGSRTGTRSATSCCPGITGLWQVSGRSELDFDDLVRLDFLYLERWSVVARPRRSC